MVEDSAGALPARVAIVGCGLIGQAWAIVFLRAGYVVTLFDADVSRIQAARTAIKAQLDALAEQQLLAGLDPALLHGRCIIADDLQSALVHAVYVQESGPENAEIKAALTQDLDRWAAPDVPIGSSTSGIAASAYSAKVPGRHRCLVVHPINPPHLVPAVEIVPAPWTAPEVTQTVASLMDRVGQTPIVQNKEVDGFVVNRMQGALLAEAMRLYAQGVASAEAIDDAVRDGLALRWSVIGPFETIHLNAPGGIADYVERYGPLYREILAEPPDETVWQAALDQGLMENLTALHPIESLDAARAMRDRGIMALIAGRKAQKAKGRT
ncbi:MAG: 3-hydroxyacyl-CoA dehydrogenase [Pseudomonadota bacterium]